MQYGLSYSVPSPSFSLFHSLYISISLSLSHSLYTRCLFSHSSSAINPTLGALVHVTSHVSLIEFSPPSLEAHCIRGVPSSPWSSMCSALPRPPRLSHDRSCSRSPLLLVVCFPLFLLSLGQAIRGMRTGGGACVCLCVCVCPAYPVSSLCAHPTRAPVFRDQEGP